MHQVLIVDDAEVHAKELAEMLRAHHIVVLNALMRGQPEKLRDEVIEELKDWRGRAPFIRYDEPVVSVNGDPCWMPTMIHEDLNALGFFQTQDLVKRAVEKWLARGAANRFLYTNTAKILEISDPGE
ncbi:hypothetical protein QLG06_04920 [Pseudomonas sp. V104_6]|uniref:hypothetical protein n=1 Tax=Pseudomonas sp. V104_6 TaxID=3044230 RepID=UPI00249DA037|nr:hypothetical protein [Pseudomonas sp. V104_6]MDI3373696.1 hypothetical protein [Pseudomonas sp. V104_6]